MPNCCLRHFTLHFRRQYIVRTTAVQLYGQCPCMGGLMVLSMNLFDAGFWALSRFRQTRRRGLGTLEAEHRAEARLIVVQQEFGVVHARDGGNEA